LTASAVSSESTWHEAGQWASLLAHLGTEQPFTAFVFWPDTQSIDQVTALAPAKWCPRSEGCCAPRT
jgi:hypothetical protein